MWDPRHSALQVPSPPRLPPPRPSAPPRPTAARAFGVAYAVVPGVTSPAGHPRHGGAFYCTLSASTTDSRAPPRFPEMAAIARLGQPSVRGEAGVQPSRDQAWPRLARPAARSDIRLTEFHRTVREAPCTVTGRRRLRPHVRRGPAGLS
ncbi:hypothetical protein PsYK624_031770 [Phanerochaete sordida]|uniref:Uncharacterized protein n=1 Tax=Phanerochaete sordida TaxID=48140 RepID=A0A9P3G3S8_9APHY|nr:hypothetical protein PsYK624_031770 [Phanerochaete sordida]